MNYYYQTAPVSYPVNYQTMNYNSTQQALNAGITGAVVGAVAGTARGIYQTEKNSEGRIAGVAKAAARDSAICGASSFAGAMAAGLSGTKGLLSLALFAGVGVGAGYMLNKILPKGEGAKCEEVKEEE